MSTDTDTAAPEPRRATTHEIAVAKQWMEANNPTRPQGWDPTSDPEYTHALEIIVFANGGRYAQPRIEQLLYLLGDLVDEEGCEYDTNGGCITHSFTLLEPGELCPHQEARDVLAGSPAAAELTPLG